MIPSFIAALIEAGRKRRILTRAQAERLADYALSKNLTDTNALRIWLASADGLHPDLARKLAAALPPVNQLPFGDYMPLAHLAEGGMGSVWLAVKKGSEELIVIKTIKAATGHQVTEAQINDALKRFEREAKITRQLQHPNVVRCLDNGIADQQTLFLALEYVDSGDLRDLVDAKGGLTEALGLAILYQVADGLAEADRLKLVHRDIKPPNIFVASNGQAKLADFGIARSTETNRTMLTMEGAIVGSPMYMSPEQILTDPTLDVRSDIYALGAVLYFCLAAEPPYNGKLQEILHQHCTAAIPDIRTKRPKISGATHELISKAMAKDRSKRFQTPVELRTAIGNALTSLGMQPGMVKDESTALRDFSHGTARTVARDIATLTADLRKQSGLDEMETIANPGLGIESPSADQATMAVDLSGRDSSGADLSGRDLQATITANLSGNPTDSLPSDAFMTSTGLPLSALTPAVAVPAATPVHASVSAPISAPVAVPVPPELAIDSLTLPPPSIADLPTMTMDLNAMATMTAVLLAQDPVLPTPPPPKDPGTSATVFANDPGTIARILAGKEISPAAPVIEGDAKTALTVPWLVLSPVSSPTDATSASDQPLVFLFGQTVIRMGKLREAPVDLCLRNYPVSIHKDACQRLSRNHLALRYDAVGHQCLIEDLNAPNGTRLDGIPVTPGSTLPLAPGVDNIVELAGVVVLWLRCLPRTGAAMSTPADLTPGPVGLDGDCRFDAVTMTRPENRSELIYAQVLRRISLGGPGADLALAGARTRSSCELAIIGGRWWWRIAVVPGMTTAAWSPLTTTTELDCGGRIWRAAPARHEQYG